MASSSVLASAFDSVESASEFANDGFDSETGEIFNEEMFAELEQEIAAAAPKDPTVHVLRILGLAGIAITPRSRSPRQPDSW